MIEWLNAISTVVIAIFAVVTSIAIICQVKTARNTNRAWIIVSPANETPQFGYILDPKEPKDEDFGKDKTNVFGVAFKNTGGTPARLIEYSVIYMYIDRLDNIPQEPDYGKIMSFDGLLLVKEDSIGGFTFLKSNPLPTKAQVMAIHRKEAFVYAYGFVSYRDVYGRKHETRFGYLYFSPLGLDPRPAGFKREELPTAYNNAT